MRTNELLGKISSGKKALLSHMLKLNVDDLKISEYQKKYLKKKLKDLKGVLNLYGNILYIALKTTITDIKQVVLLDYGGGTGLMSLLAVKIGVGTVIYNDIYEVSCSDVRELSRSLGISINHIICGDIIETVSYLKSKSIKLDVIVSYDVLEHIYDLSLHFDKIYELNGSIKIIYASGANWKNPFIFYRLKKYHLIVEEKGRERSLGHKERDALMSYYEIRKNIISRYAPDLEHEQIKLLAKTTRGLRKEDIEKCVDEFKKTGVVSYVPEHPTNTCDPYTGNWCERMIDFNWLKSVLIKKGYDVCILPGYYYWQRPFLKRVVGIFLNLLIKTSGNFGYYISPYYILYAKK